MQIQFYKYQGTGNDFVVIDNRDLSFPKNDTKLISRLCDRKFGVGADGLMLLEDNDKYDFTMVYYNSDGSTSTMCGNGGRCLVAFARYLGKITSEAHFEASDGYHFAKIEKDSVALQMIDVDKVILNYDYSYVYTGSPHHVVIKEDVAALDVKKEGALIRYSDLYGEEGSNINFVQKINDTTFRLRTYERGVEDETLSCGTGATAVAIAMFSAKQTKSNEVDINVEGGKLKITFDEKNGVFENVFLIGKAEFVFKGVINV